MFADLHDTAERMAEKGVIRDIVPWNRSRPTLYWRLRRVLAEDRVKKEIRSLKQSYSDKEIDELFKKWFFEERGSSEVNNYLLVVLKILIFDFQRNTCGKTTKL